MIILSFYSLFFPFLRSSSHALIPKRLESQTTPHKIEMTWRKTKGMKQRKFDFISLLFFLNKRKKYSDCIANVSLSVTPCRCPRLMFGSLHNRLNSIQTHDFSISILHQTEIYQSQSQKNIYFLFCSFLARICLQP